MKKKRNLRWLWLLPLILVAVLFGAFKYIQSQTKKASPESTASLNVDGNTIEVFYNRPSKKDREIFGALVPYGVTWRTGANEATTFETNHDLNVAGKKLAKGKYTLWTIPQSDHWTVIFNSKMYPWGVAMKGLASREPEFDVLKVDVPTQENLSVVEQFTITFEGTPVALTLAWDKTKVAVPVSFE